MSQSTVLEPGVAAASGTPATLGAVLKRLCEAYVAWRTETAAIAALRSMSDRALTDIGLTRSEIARAVKGEAVRPGA